MSTNDDGELAGPGEGGPRKAAILVVHGGRNPARARWLKLCLEALAEHTIYPNYHIYVWNNDVGAVAARELTGGLSRCTLIDADPLERLEHPHAQGLQRLYERARSDGAHYVVTFDADAMPIKTGWLTSLIEAIDGGAALAGVWSDERSERWEPSVHPSCLCTTTDFVDHHEVRFGEVLRERESRYDTLASFTRVALEAGLPIHRLLRSNRNNLHRLMAGIYGDTIYHHGGGSRFEVVYGEAGRNVFKNLLIRELGTAMLLTHRAGYLAWLRGEAIAGRVLFVLGMYASGTSVLTECLEQCGVNGSALKGRSPQLSHGNLAQREARRLNDSMLTRSGGSWSQPPDRVEAGDDESSAVRTLLSTLESSGSPGALADPRFLLTDHVWFGAATNPGFVGTFRHPEAVARSLLKRDGMAVASAHALWLRYNRELVRLHKVHRFPLIEFELSDREAFAQTVAAVAAELGLEPRFHGLKRIVDARARESEVAPDVPVPEECKEIYDYLRIHRHTGWLDPEKLEALLVAWGEFVDTPETTPRQEIERWARTKFRSAPPPLRRVLRPPLHAMRRLRARAAARGRG